LACASDGKVGHPYVVGDEAANAAHGYPPFFDELLRSVTAQSKYEATLAAGAADGSVGVPAGAATRLTLQVLDVQPVEELDGEGGCRLLQTTLAPGDGWATPRAGWEVQVDFSLTAPDGALIRTTRGGEPLALTCGASTAAGLPRVFEHVVRMKRGQRACFRAAAEWAGEAAAAAAADGLFEFEIELLDWTEVCEIPKTHGELRAKVLQKGGSYDRPHAGARTRVRFSVALASAQPAGAGAPPPPLEASLDDGEVFVVDDETMLPAIDMAVRDMSPGARLELSVPPAWGYSQALADARGLAAAAVDAPLTVALELLSFEQATAEWDLVAAERLELQQRKKAQGNALFGQGRYARALDKYETSLSVVHDHEEDFDEASERPLVRTMRVQCLLNQATCQLKLGEPRRALDLAGKALSLDGASAKGVLRRGQAHLALGNLSEAKADLLKVWRAPQHGAAAPFTRCDPPTRRAARAGSCGASIRSHAGALLPVLPDARQICERVRASSQRGIAMRAHTRRISPAAARALASRRHRWQVAKLEPTNRDARDGLVAVQKAQAEHKLKEKALFVHMFDNKA
jgi:FK506-binding protein 4/5